MVYANLKVLSVRFLNIGESIGGGLSIVSWLFLASGWFSALGRAVESVKTVVFKVLRNWLPRYILPMVDAPRCWRFLHLHTWPMLRDVDVSLHLHTWPMLRNVDVSCICTHGRCYAMLTSLAFAHMADATRCWRLLHLHTWPMLRNVDVSCICTHGRCYAMLTSLAFADMADAMRCWRLLHLHTWPMLRNVDVSCICTHGQCSGMFTSLAFAHMADATRCWRLLHLHTWPMLRNVDVSCICTHGRCYAMLTSLAFAHMADATQCWSLLQFAHMADAMRCWRLLHLHTWPMLRNVEVSCNLHTWRMLRDVDVSCIRCLLLGTRPAWLLTTLLFLRSPPGPKELLRIKVKYRRIRSDSSLECFDAVGIGQLLYTTFLRGGPLWWTQCPFDT